MTLVLSPDTIVESGETSTVTATLDRASSEATTVTVTVTPVSPAEAGDYTLSESLELTVPAGATDSTGVVTITAVDNGEDTPIRKVTVSATATNPQGVTGPDDVTLTIADDDGAPELAIGDVSVTEGDSENPAAVFTVTLTPAAEDEVTVSWIVSEGTAKAAQDFVLNGGTLTFAPGVVEQMVSLTVTSDVVDEPDETFTVTLSNPTGGAAIRSDAAVATGTIEDDDDTPVATLALRPSSIAESGGTSTVTAALDHPSSEETTVTVSVEPVSPAVEGDYTLSANRELTIAAGATASTGEVTVTAESNDVYEGDKTLTVSAVAANRLAVTDPAPVTLTITDDEDPPELSIADATVDEGGSGDSATLRFTVTLDRSATGETGEVTVSWETADGTAEAGTDYVAGSGSLTFGAGDTSEKVEVAVLVTGDDVDEPDETFTVTLSNVSGAALVKAVGTGTITDDDDEPAVTLVLSPDTIVESGGTSTVTATLDRASSEETTVTVSVEPVAPAVEGDYTLGTNRVLTIPAGATASTGEVTITAVDNDVGTPDKEVTVSATAENTQGVKAPRAVTLTIAAAADSPATGTVTVTTETTFTEGETLTADTSGVTDEDGLTNATWAYQWVRTPDGGDDEDISDATGATYVPVFADAGATLKVKVTVTDDEGHEATFESAPTTAVAARSRPTVTVTSDDAVTEGSPAVFTLRRTGDTAAELDVDYAVTATGNFGVTPATATATFLANDATVQVTVATTGDDTDEAHGSVTLTLTADTGADPAYVLGDPATATAEIRDDENVDPTGTPTIDDTTPVVGQTLTANTSGIGDSDGLTGATYAYQWIRVADGTQTPIASATAASYTVVAEDMGSTLKVEVSFTDDGGAQEKVESAVTSAVEAAPRPRVTVERVASPVEEGAGAQFRVKRTGVTEGALTVHYGVSETGEMVASDEEDEKSVAFGDDDTEVTVTVPTEEDTVHEADSVVTVTLTADASYDLGLEEQRSAEVTVADDDNAAPTGTVTIDDTTPVVGQKLKADASGVDDPDGLTSPTFTYQWLRVSGGTETPVAGATAASYTVADADVGVKLKVRVTFTDDDETVETVESAETAAVLPVVTVVSGGAVTEGSAAVFTLRRTGDPAKALEVAYEVTATGAFGVTTGADTATFPANDATVQVSVVTTGDDTHEAHGTVTVTLQTGASYALGADAAATATILDDDDSPATGTVTVTGTPTEGETLTADTSGLTDGDGLTGATWVYQWVRTPAGGGSDENIPGATSQTYTSVFADAGATLKVKVTVTDDEGHQATLTSAPTAAVAARSRPVVTVTSDDDVTEGSPAVFTLTRTGATAQPLAVPYRTTATGDYGVTPGTDTATFLAGNATVQVTVATTGDDTDEAHGSVTVTLAADPGADPAYVLGDPATATAVVRDDDDMPAVTLKLDPSSVGESGGASTVTARLSHPSSEETTVTVSVAPVAPAEEGDYTLSENLTLTIPAGETDSEGLVTITAENNVLDTPDKTLTVSGTVKNTLGVEGPQDVTLTIEDDDVPPQVGEGGLPVVTMAVESNTVTEASPAVFTLSRTGDPTRTLEVAYEVAATGDYGVTTGARTATFLAGNATVKVNAATTGDDTHEAPGTVTVTLTADTGDDPAYVLGDPATGTVTVRDDDDSATTGTVTVTGTPTEGETLTADTSGLTDADGLTGATYTYQWVRTPDGGSDENITGATSKTYTPVFADAGATLKVEVTVTDDEGHQASFTSAPTSAVAAKARPSVTVASDGNVTEGGAVTFTLTRTGDTAQTLAVAYKTMATGDYGVTPGTGTATFLAGNATVQVTVATTGDEDHEAHGTVTVTLTADTAADPAYLLGDPATATAAVRDDENVAPTGAPTIDDTTPVVRFTVADPGGVLSGTVPATATIEAGETEETVRLETEDDGVHEAPGTVTLTLAEDAAYGLGSEAERSAEVTVRDDDDSPASGTVTVTGTPTEGETLTADTSGVTDGDGLANAAWTWQWVRTPAGGGGDETLSGATSKTYVPVFADAGATLKVKVTVTDDEGHEASFTSAPTSAVAAKARPSVTVASGGAVTEGGAVTFTLRRTGDTAEELEVAYETTATGAFGVTTGAGTATFLANDATVQVSVDTTGDDTHEAHGTVTVTLTADPGADPAYVLGDSATATATVRDDDDSATTGTVTVTTTTTFTEGETLTADTSGPTDGDGLANAVWAWQWVRTPNGGSDEDISGATSQTYVPVFADAGATLEVKVTVTDDEGHEASFTSAPTPTVAARTRPEVTVTSDGAVTEGSPAVFTLRRTGDTAAELEVDYAVTATGAFGVTTGADTATFLAGNATVQVSVDTTGDTTHEADGTVTVTLTEDTGADPAYLLGDPATATATVRDDDDSATTGTVTVTGTPTEGETLTADVSGLTDADGLDSAGYAYQWVRTPAGGGGDEDISGATSKTYVPVFADTGATLKVKVTITDDEGHQATLTSTPTAAVAALPRPVVTVASDGNVPEGSPALFTLTRTGDTAQTLPVAYDVTATGDFGVTTGARTATFPASNATVQVSVATTGDTTHEADGSVTVTLTANPAAYELGADTAATATILDDDNAAPTGTVTLDDTTPVAGQRLRANPSGIGDPDGLTSPTFTYQWLRTSGGSDTDISGATSATYTVAAADIGARLKVRVGFTDDDGTVETVESAPTGTVGAYTIAVTSPTVTEGDDGVTLLRFALTRSETGRRVELGWRVAAQSTAQTGATSFYGMDFVGLRRATEGTVVFPPGVRGRTVVFQVIPDIIDESDETVVLELFPVSGTPAGVTFPSTATGTIVDDDTATVSISPTVRSSVDEGDTGTRELVFGVHMDFSPSDREVTVGYAVVGGTAESGTDYEAPASGVVTFPALSGAAQKITLRVHGDTDAERHETLAVELRDPSGGAELGTARAEGTICNDDGLVLWVDPPEVDEGDAREDRALLTFRVRLSGPSETDVTVDYRVETDAGTATAGSDYRSKTGTATVKSGLTEAVVNVHVVEDTELEPDETVVMVFESPRGALLDPGSGRVTGTIRNDDLAATSQAKAAETVVTVGSESSPVTEGEAAVFVLRRTGDASLPLTVAVEVSEAGRVLGGDAPTEARFGEDETEARLRVETEDDATAEADGRVTATVVAGAGYAVSAEADSAGVDVLDNDGPAVPGETASEETETLWSATMTVAGIDGSVGASGSDLAAPGWSEDGVEYALERLRWLGPPDGRLEVRLSRRPSSAEELTLHAGALTLALAEGGSGRTLVWPVEGEPWTVGEEVALRLTRTVVAGEDDDAAAGPGISVADARVNESAGTPLAFRVTLDEAQPSAVSVRYETSDGSAVAGADYVAATGVVRFEPGETEKTVDVAVLEDAHDEGEETMTLVLSSPFGAEVSDGVATGTIVNTDPMPGAWLGRFGRTVAGQVVEAVEARMTAVRRPGMEVSVAGQRVGAAGATGAFDEAGSRDGGLGGGRLAGGLGGESDSEGLDMRASRDAGAAGGRLAEWLGGGTGLDERTVSDRELLTGTSFALTQGTAESGFVSLWGRGVVTGFDGRDGALSVDGEVATGLLGADWARDDWAAGLIVGHSRGEGDYSGQGGGQGAGTVESSLTGVYPWGRRALNDRVMVWGVAGYGEGTLTLEPEGQARIEADMDLAMAAAGLRGVLMEAPAEGGLELAAKMDGLVVRSASEAARGRDGGMLEASSAQVTRLRLGLEGTRAFGTEGGGTLTPSFGLGVRHDGGDAETGLGVDVGGGLAWADPTSGVTAELHGRGLLAHEASGFREVGLSGSLAFDPSPSSDRGLSLSLTQTVGASATGGVDALYGRETMAGLGADGAETVDSPGRRRLGARVGYGLSAFGGRFTGTPELGFGVSESGRDYRLGWRLTPEGGAGSFELSLEATRREAANGDDGPEHGVSLRATIRW